MMHHTPHSGKFKRLVRRLRALCGEGPVSVETIATGILERLWHATIGSALRGDIGRFDNEEIAEFIGWHGDANELIAVLVDSGWLDECPTHRLLVHDWHDHAPRHVKANAVKQGGFLTPQNSPKEPPNDAKEPPNDDLEPLGAALGTKNTPKEVTQDLTIPNVTKPDRPNERFARAGERSDEFRIPQIDIAETQWKDLTPLMKRIAQVVTKRTDVSARHLREPDYELCARAAAIATYHLSRAWLDPVLRAIEQRRDPADNPWAHFRSMLIAESEKRGHKFHDLESLVDVPKREQPAEVTNVT